MLKLPALNIPIAIHKFDGTKIYDKVRKKYVECTPEEWVRQNVIALLTSNYGYSLSRMQVEVGMKINNKDFRVDILCYDKKANPYLIVECKSPDVKLNQAALNQIGIYNIAQKTNYLLITNGLDFLAYKTDYDTQQILPYKEIPIASQT